jgi:AI-2 transport protein TqsA
MLRLAEFVQGWLRRHGWPAWATSLVVVILVYAILIASAGKQLQQAAAALNLGKLAGVLGALLGSIAGLASNFVFLLSLLLFLSVDAGGVGDRLESIAVDRPTSPKPSDTSRGAPGSTSAWCQPLS